MGQVKHIYLHLKKLCLPPYSSEFRETKKNQQQRTSTAVTFC